MRAKDQVPNAAAAKKGYCREVIAVLYPRFSAMCKLEKSVRTSRRVQANIPTSFGGRVVRS